MNSPYQELKPALRYLDFLNSDNGKIQKSVLLKAIKSCLPKNKNFTILDGGCGPGWLAGTLAKEYENIEACDASEFFIQLANGSFPKINFQVADLEKPLPYPHASFNAVILNMVGPDLNNLSPVFKNLAVLIKTGGKLIMTIPNPKYTYPAAEWKRGILGFLLGKKPTLKIKNPPPDGMPIKREFGEDVVINSYYHSLPAYINNAGAAGLKLELTLEIKSQTDSKEFGLNYQLNRYPLLTLLEFKKLAQ